MGRWCCDEFKSDALWSTTRPDLATCRYLNITTHTCSQTHSSGSLALTLLVSTVLRWLSFIRRRCTFLSHILWWKHFFITFTLTASIRKTALNSTMLLGLLVISNIYNIPHLRLLCVNRLAKELDVDHACIIWHCAGSANEDWLRKRAANFCLMHWGRVVRTRGFLKLPRQALVELSQEIDMEGWVVGGDELEVVGRSWWWSIWSWRSSTGKRASVAIRPSS